MWGVSLLTGGLLFQAGPFWRFRSNADWFSSELELYWVESGWWSAIISVGPTELKTWEKTDLPPRGGTESNPFGITERSIEWLGWVLAEVALRGCTSKELFSASGNASHGHRALCTTIDFCICLFVRV